MQRAIRTALESAASCGNLSAAVFEALFSSAVLACLLCGCALSFSFASAPPQTGAPSHQPAARIRRGRGIGAVCWLAAKSSPTPPTPCTRLQAALEAPQSAVMGPPPGVARGSGRRGCSCRGLPFRPLLPPALFAFAHSWRPCPATSCF